MKPSYLSEKTSYSESAHLKRLEQQGGGLDVGANEPHPFINFKDKVNTPDGPKPLWTLAIISLEEYSKFFLDGHISDFNKAIVAINKKDHSVYVFSECAIGKEVEVYLDDCDDHYTDFKYAEDVALNEFLPDILNSLQAVVYSSETAEVIRNNRFIPKFYNIDDDIGSVRRECILGALSDSLGDGSNVGIDLFDNSANKHLRVIGVYQEPDVTLLPLYQEKCPEPSQKLKKESSGLAPDSIPF